MKGCLRFFVIVLLIALLAFFFWMQKGPELTAAVNSYLAGALERYHDLMALFSANGDATSPEEGTDEGGSPGTPPADNAGGYGDYKPGEAINATLEQALRQGLTNMDSPIDLSAISPTKDEVKNAMSAIIYSSPEYFYLRSAYNITSNSRGVQSITPTYCGSAAEVAVMKATYEAKIAEIVAGAPQEGTDFDKILYLHDYFITNYSYDNTLTIRDAYTFFVGKTGVCQAYMLALIATARELGIESIPVTSDAMKHAWNLVKIDGAWYHVDLTWDDSISYPTMTSYTYFLQSDAGLLATDVGKKESDSHHDWVAAVPATDTKYDGAAYRNATTPMVKSGGVYYVAVPVATQTQTVHGTILYGTDVTSMTKFVDVKGGFWVAGDNRYYSDCYAGIAVENGYLYYNSGNTVTRVEIARPTLGAVTVTVTSLGASESIYGILGVENGTVTYVTATSPSGTYVQKTCTVQ